MPTGYTSKIEDGISFNEFVFGCARAFGACVTMRDDNSDTPNPEKFEPSDYHSKRILETELELQKIKNMSVEQAGAEAKEEYERDTNDNTKRELERMGLKEKYETMLKKVKSWNPPTVDHVGLKDFMEEQLVSSIKFDCYKYGSVFTLLSGREWLEKEIAKLIKSINYHKNEDKKEKERFAGRNKWVKDLRDSLCTK